MPGTGGSLFNQRPTRKTMERLWQSFVNAMA